MGQTRPAWAVGIIGFLLTVAVDTRADNTSVCVDIVLNSLEEPESDKEPIQTKSPDEGAPAPEAQEARQDPEASEAPPVKDRGTATPDGIPHGEEGAPNPSEASEPESPATPETRSMPEEKPPVSAGGESEALPPDRPGDRTSLRYLKRLMEHFVTHQPGYVAVEASCDETIRVELYPLARGWTVFVRYSGTGREERVDALYPDELSPFAERAVLAVLNDVAISETINRENVLRADSMKSVQRIRGTNHFVLSVGTQLRGGSFPTVIEDAEDGEVGSVERRIRVMTPFTTSLGYRGRFENWGLEAMALVGFGTDKTAVRDNPEGGHIDFGGLAGFGIHFLRYFDPRGLISFYVGAGGTFELLWFSAIKAVESRDDKDRSYLLSGGLDVDLVFGWEFMRANAVQFLLQGELNLPAYMANSENDHGTLDTWFPGISVKLGIIF